MKTLSAALQVFSHARNEDGLGHFPVVLSSSDGGLEYLKAVNTSSVEENGTVSLEWDDEGISRVSLNELIAFLRNVSDLHGHDVEINMETQHGNLSSIKRLSSSVVDRTIAVIIQDF